MNRLYYIIMSISQYEQYLNMHIFAKHWRKYKRISPKQDLENFQQNMNYSQYVDAKYLNTINGKNVLIYLLSVGSKYQDKSLELRKLLKKIKEPSDVILISESPFKTYANRVINSLKHLRIKTYLHENFSIIIPEGPLCEQHRIMERNEVYRLLNEDLFVNLVNLPKILIEDPQCIWIGAEVGDVVEIKSNSDVSGESITYRVVVAKSGRVISFRDNILKVEEEDDGSDEDENIKEVRDEVAADNSDLDE